MDVVHVALSVLACENMFNSVGHKKGRRVGHLSSTSSAIKRGDVWVTFPQHLLPAIGRPFTREHYFIFLSSE